MKAALAFALLCLPAISQSSPGDSKLRALGEGLRKEILKDSPLLELPDAAALLTRLVSELDNTPPPIKIEIVRSNKMEIFVLPAGSVLFPARLFLTIHSEDELARHLAHAIGHIRLRHGLREAKPSTVANLQTIPLMLIGSWDGIHHNLAQPTALPSGFRAQQATWEREADDFAISLLSGRTPIGLTPELRQIQSQIRSLTISSNPPSLFR